MDLTQAYDLILDKLTSWGMAFIAMLPNLLLALVVFCVFWYLAKGARKVAYKATMRISHNQEISDLIAAMTRFGVTVVGLFIALGLLNLDKTVTSLLAGVGVVGLALGFAFQDSAANFISGVMLAFRSPFSIGQFVETNGVLGVVDSVNLRSTILRRTDGQIIYIPNKDVFQNTIINYSQVSSRRVDLPVGVSYADDLQKVKRIAAEAVSGVHNRVADREVEVFFEAFGGSSIDLLIRFWIDFTEPIDYFKARSEAILAVKSAFDAAGITIPFPIRTLDFGISGGEKLSAMWPAQNSDADAALN